MGNGFSLAFLLALRRRRAFRSTLAIRTCSSPFVVKGSARLSSRELPVRPSSSSFLLVSRPANSQIALRGRAFGSRLVIRTSSSPFVIEFSVHVSPLQPPVRLSSLSFLLTSCYSNLQFLAYRRIFWSHLVTRTYSSSSIVELSARATAAREQLSPGCQQRVSDMSAWNTDPPNSCCRAVNNVSVTCQCGPQAPHKSCHGAVNNVSVTCPGDHDPGTANGTEGDTPGRLFREAFPNNGDLRAPPHSLRAPPPAAPP